MLLSEMFEVERDVDFKVKGYESRFRLTLNVNGIECLKIKSSASDVWETPLTGTIFNVISIAPDGIIHLPPPLTDEQRNILRALYTLGYRWLVKDKYGSVYAYETKPHTKYQDIWHCEDGGLYLCYAKPTKCLEPIVSWPDPEPYDIGKALGIKR